MNEEKSNPSFFSADESPIPLPPAEDAWLLMQEKLDVNMPVARWYSRYIQFKGWSITAVTITVITFLVIRLAPHRAGRQHPVQAYSHAAEPEGQSPAHAQGLREKSMPAGDSFVRTKGDRSFSGEQGEQPVGMNPAGGREGADKLNSGSKGAAGSGEGAARRDLPGGGMVSAKKDAAGGVTVVAGKKGVGRGRGFGEKDVVNAGTGSARRDLPGGGMVSAKKGAAGGVTERAVERLASGGGRTSGEGSMSEKERASHNGLVTGDKGGAHRRPALAGKGVAGSGSGIDRKAAANAGSAAAGKGMSHGGGAASGMAGNERRVRADAMYPAKVKSMIAETGDAGMGAGKEEVRVADSLLRRAGFRAKTPLAGQAWAGKKPGENNSGGKSPGGKLSGGNKKPALPGEVRPFLGAGLSVAGNFPLGQEQSAPYNVNGKSNLLSDYVPAPYLRWYINDRLYVEGALNINSPQYTRSLAIDSTGDTTSAFIGTTTTGPQILVNKLTLKKLYYTEIQVSFNYRVYGNFYLGAGLQFSRLMNGIALHSASLEASNGLGPVTELSSGTVRLKDSADAYSKLRKTDWRVLFEASYSWKRLTLGLRYQQALSPYLTVLPDGARGKDRNVLFGCYFQYNIWQRSRRK